MRSMSSIALLLSVRALHKIEHEKEMRGQVSSGMRHVNFLLSRYFHHGRNQCDLKKLQHYADKVQKSGMGCNPGGTVR